MSNEPLDAGRKPINSASETNAPIIVQVPAAPINWIAVATLVSIVVAVGSLAVWLDGQFGILDGRIDELAERIASLETLIDIWRNPLPAD